MGRSETSVALATAKRIRGLWIDFTYELPDPATPEAMRLWSDADNAMYQMVQLLEANDA